MLTINLKFIIKNKMPMNNIKKQFLCAILIFATWTIHANNPIPIVLPTTDSLPRVFLLGEKDRDFERVKTSYRTTLLEACQGDMETAYYTWMHMMKHFESYAKQQGYELEGLKMWLYVFWNKDGSIAHIGYFLKPNSRNLRDEELPKLTQIFEGFSKTYRFPPLKVDKGFSNYTHASFPILLEQWPAQNKQ